MYDQLQFIEEDFERLRTQSVYHNDVTTENLNLQVIKAMLRIIIRLLFYIVRNQSDANPR